MEKITSYTDLRVWQEGRTLATLIYKISSTFPKTEQFGLTDQMRRAVVSIPSNIAEGFGRASAKEKTQFYYVAKGSLAELETQVYIALDIKYIDEQQFESIMQLASLTHRLLQGLIKANKERH